MKLDGLTHPKTKELALTLGVELPHAVGLLDFLWAFVAQQTPRGNVGKWSDGVIAQESQWSGDAEKFVSALVSAGFLDRCDEHRLLVHDWSEHAPNWVHSKLKRKGQQIISPDLTPDLTPDSPPASDASTSQAKPSQGNTYVEPGGPTCPQKQIVDLYHEHCPSLPRVQKLTPARQQAIRSRWRNELPTLDHWRDYFTVVSQSKFLTGNAPPTGGRSKPFLADIDFLSKQANVVKVMEGKYDD